MRRAGRATLVLLAMLACTSVAKSQKYQAKGDIWKYRIPQQGIHGEFDNGDAMGILSGKYIKTDRSVNVVKNGKTYCFTAAASQTLFKYASNTNLVRALSSWQKMKSKDAQS